MAEYRKPLDYYKTQDLTLETVADDLEGGDFTRWNELILAAKKDPVSSESKLDSGLKLYRLATDDERLLRGGKITESESPKPNFIVKNLRIMDKETEHTFVLAYERMCIIDSSNYLVGINLIKGKIAEYCDQIKIISSRLTIEGNLKNNEDLQKAKTFIEAKNLIAVYIVRKFELINSKKNN
jgi:hypothetical protein